MAEEKKVLYEESWQAAKRKILEKATWCAGKGYTECNLLIDGMQFPPLETIRHFLTEGYDVIYASVDDLSHEILVLSWAEGCSGVVSKRTLFGKKQSSVEKMYKYFKKLGI